MMLEWSQKQCTKEYSVAIITTSRRRRIGISKPARVLLQAKLLLTRDKNIPWFMVDVMHKSVFCSLFVVMSSVEEHPENDPFENDLFTFFVIVFKSRLSTRKSTLITFWTLNVHTGS
jgi:hypothetical protein